MENIALAGIIGTFNNVIDDVYDYGKAKLKQELSKAIVKKKIPELIRNQLDFVRCVKTLWQVDRAVDIDEFYCDSHLIAPSVDQDKKQRHLIKLSSDFSGSYNVAIRGIAGQGKSIFLRYLCIREFKAGQRIPIFIELRRIQKNESLFDHIRRFFEILNLSIDHDLFKVIAKSGKFIFFLDAFDEVNDNIKPKILNEIEYLASLCPDCQFIVTTRPSTAIEMSALFDV